MSGKAKGIRKQVLGGLLFASGGAAVIFDLMTSNPPELFYIVLAASGCFLFIYGILQNRKG
jgi:hypothetical protein